MRILIALVLILLTSLSITACNTVQGVGKDLESAGQTIQGM